MSIFEESQYFFSSTLPDAMMVGFDSMNIFLRSYWWFFALLALAMLFISFKLFRIGLIHKEKMQTFRVFLDRLTNLRDIREVQTKLLEFSKLLNARYSLLYELKGETYRLIQNSHIPEYEKTKVNIPFRIKASDLKTFTKTGNFSVEYFLNIDKSFMLLFFSSKKIAFEDYRGFISSALNYYAVLVNSNKMKIGELNTSGEKDISMSLVKLQMDKYQFLKFLVFLVLKATHAKGAKLINSSGEVVFENMSDKQAPLQKVFHIRNPPYKLEFYNEVPLEAEMLHRIGSFLDMMGAFLISIDKKSEMIQNYLQLLKFTNDAIELENKYYKDHSLIVSTVSTEVAKSLFLSEEEIDNIALGGVLHDIGMLGDLSKILGESKLDSKALDSIKMHPLIGSLMVEPIAHIYPIANIVKYHHERFDGKGYPFGLKGSQIPLSAQVVALAEFYAGITGDREYRAGKTHEEAVQLIEEMNNKMFNPVVVNAFLDIEKSIHVKMGKIKQDLENKA